MGGEPLYTMLLLGLGVRQLSMPPHQLPEIRRVIRGIRIETAQALAAQALTLESAQAVSALLESGPSPGACPTRQPPPVESPAYESIAAVGKPRTRQSIG